MAAPTLEEAGKCPRCQKPGEQGAPQPSAEPGVRVIPFTCRTEGCRWFNTGWIVQLNPDGSIPEPSETPRGAKQFHRPSRIEIVQNMEQAAQYAQYFQNQSQER